MNHADVYTSDKFTNNEVVDSETGVVCVVVAEAIILWLQVVAAVEEFADVSTASSFNNKLAAGVIWCIVGRIDDKVVNQQQVASAFAGDGVELFFSHNGGRSCEVDIGTKEQLVSNLQYHPWHEEGKETSNPEVW